MRKDFIKLSNKGDIIKFDSTKLKKFTTRTTKQSVKKVSLNTSESMKDTILVKGKLMVKSTENFCNMDKICTTDSPHW